jgi:spore coat polysaccharide biosynthesis predicted glycosyltransferase SpsG
MSRPVLYFAVTNHGFGHAVRSASVVANIIKLNPEILPILVTTAPRWLLDSYILGEYIQRPRGFDVGVIQSDSLKMDKLATKEKLEQIIAQSRSIIASEVNFIKTNRVGLVLADLPPLAALIAKNAGLPCWMIGNFGWDFIYRDWGQEFTEISDWISRCYNQCDRLFKLPLAEAMTPFPHVTETGLTGGTPRYSEEQLRQEFKLNVLKEKTILLSFGGLGLEAIPYHNLESFPDWQFITFERNAPELPNLVRLQDKPDHLYRPVDFMPICDQIISKPGYSTFAEALKLEVPIVSLIREGFAESPILLAGIQDYSYHQIITSEEFFQGNWDFLRQPTQPPRLTVKLPKDGAESIAQAVVEYFERLQS